MTRFGSLETILASRGSLKPYGAAHKLLGAEQPGADARCATAASNLAVLRMRPQPQQEQLPVQQLQCCCSDSLAALQDVRREPPSEQQWQAAAAVSLLYPARVLHMQQCTQYLQVLQECLQGLGMTEQHTNWTSPEGLWCDLLVRVGGSGAANLAVAPLDSSNGSSKNGSIDNGSGNFQPASAAGDCQGDAPVSSADACPPASGMADAAASLCGTAAAAVAGDVGGSGWVAFQILTPGELCAGKWVLGCIHV